MKIIYNIIRNIRQIYAEPAFFQMLFQIATPIILQNFLMSSLNMVNSLMVGQLGDTSIASIGLAGQLFFLLNLILFGIMSGSAIFTAQLWGKKDIANIRRVLGFAIKFGFLTGIFFLFLANIFPANILRLYTNDTAVVQLGSEYLKIFSWSFPLFAVSFAYSMVMRTTGDVRTPLFASIFALIINSLLSWILIFGELGFPKLGLLGAAWASLMARALEFFVIILITYKDRDNPTAATIRDILNLDMGFIVKILKPVLPVFFNELFWSLGITTYNAIYAHIGTDAIAAINLISPIEQLSFVAFLGIGNATSIIVGNLIGEGKVERAYTYANKSLWLQMFGGMVIGIIVYAISRPFLGLYNVSNQVVDNSWSILAILSMALWIRASNHTLIIGIFRAGGDTTFSLLMDGFVIWLIGVPLAAFGAFILHLPVYYVYALALSEEITKLIIGLVRFFSRKWIHNLTSVVELA